MSSKKIQMAYCVFPDTKTAEQICELLVRERFIACANILPPHKSIYEWKDQLESTSEVAAWLKTSVSKTAALKEKIREIHPYEVPALVFFAATDALPEFADWVDTQSS